MELLPLFGIEIPILIIPIVFTRSERKELPCLWKKQGRKKNNQ
ncbi:hypothetical protein [Tenuibacillus multivorans]|nr:hypothetical protein [Tenuibacillus multivorans]GEL77588.1 hypothetical protein TMU01_18230 [Tenuibacillus multivorans]